MGSWIMQNGTLTNTDFINIPADPFHGDAPFTFWRIRSGVNNDMPYSPFMINIPARATKIYFADKPAVKMYYGYIPVTQTHYGTR